MSIRAQVNEYIANEYGAQPEFLWEKTPDCAVYRHESNRKWFGIIMVVGRDKFGFDSDELVEVMNVKVPDRMLLEALKERDGFYPAYHMNKEHWISIFLDGTVEFEEVCDLVDESFEGTR